MKIEAMSFHRTHSNWLDGILSSLNRQIAFIELKVHGKLNLFRLFTVNVYSSVPKIAQRMKSNLSCVPQNGKHILLV